MSTCVISSISNRHFLYTSLFLLTLWMPNSLFASPQKNAADLDPLTSPPQTVLDAVADVEEPDFDSDVQLIKESVQFSIEANGLVNKTIHRVLRVLTKSGIEEAARINSSWTPWYESKPTVEARVISRRGVVDMLDSTTLVESTVGEVDSGVYSDDRVLQGVIPNVRLGSVVETKVLLQQHRPFCDVGTKHLAFANLWDLPAFWSVSFSAPANMPLVFHSNGPLDLIPKLVGDKDGTRTWRVTKTFESPLVTGWRQNTLDRSSPYPWVGVTSGQSWNEIAKHYSQLVDQQISESNIAEIAATISPTDDSPEEITKAVMASVSDRVRYTGFEFGILSIIPKPPETSWQTGLGDCKDKSTLVVALLRHFGLKADVALLNVGSATAPATELPALNSFDHAIVRIDGERPVWIDPTAEYMHSSGLPEAASNRLALVANASTGSLELTPRAPLDSNYASYEYKRDIFKYEHPRLQQQIEKLGIPALSSRRSFAYASKKKVIRDWEKSVKESRGITDVSSMDFSDPLRVESPLNLTADYREPWEKYWEANEVVVPISTEQITGHVEEELLYGKDYGFYFYGHAEATDDSKNKEREFPEREAPFVFTHFERYQVVHRIKPPIGYRAKALPKPITIEAGEFSLGVKFEEQPDRTVNVTLWVDTGNRDLTVAEYNSLRKQFDDSIDFLLSEEQMQVRFVDELASLSSTKDLLGAVKKLQQLNPDYDKSWQFDLRKAETLLAMGFGDIARNLAERAVAANPESAIVQAVCGHIFSHNQVGVLFANGFDRDRAIEHYAKASKLEPENGNYIWRHADAVSRNGHGITNLDPVRRKEAIKLFITALEDDNFTFSRDNQRQLLLALTLVKDWDGLGKMLEEYEKDAYSLPFELVYLTKTSGSDAAERALNAYDLTPSEREEYCLECAQALLQIDEFDLSSEMLLKVNSAALLETRKILQQKVGKLQKTVVTPADPSSLKKALFEIGVWLVIDGKEISKIRPYFADACSEAEIREFLGPAVTIFQGNLFREQTSGPIPPYRKLWESTWSAIRKDDHWFTPSLENPLNFAKNAPIFYFEEEGVTKILPAGSAGRHWGDRAFEILCADNISKANKAIAISLLDEAFDLQTNNGTRRPKQFSTSAFTNLYKFGSGKLSDAKLKLAAAALCNPQNEEALDYLHASVEASTESESISILNALRVNYLTLRDDRAIDASQKLVELSGRNNLTWTYYRLERFDDAADAAAKKYTVPTPTSTQSIWMSRVEMARGDFKAARKQMRRYSGGFLSGIFGMGNSKSTIPQRFANSYAWALIFAGTNPSRAVEVAEVAMEEKPDINLRHTYATALAANGQAHEAIEQLKSTIDSKLFRNFESDDDVVLGKTAEKLGLIEEAKFYYLRCVDVPNPTYNGTDDLAKQWLSELESDE